MKQLRNKASRATQSGVSLLEVLIAVVVLSFGLLGLAGLQMTSLRNNQSALERSNAVMLTYTIVEAMHADRAAARDNDFDIAMGDAAPGDGSFASESLATWLGELQNALGPDASGSIACAAVAGSESVGCTITVQWDDSRGLGGDAAQTIVTEVQL